MPTTYVPEEDTLLRHVKPSHVIRADDGTPEGLFPEAFELRDDEDYLSAAWVESCGGATAAQIKTCIHQFRKKLTVKKKAVFAAGQVQAIKSACLQFGDKVRVCHEPDPPLEAHVALRQYRDADKALLSLLAVETWSELHCNASY